MIYYRLLCMLLFFVSVCSGQEILSPLSSFPKKLSLKRFHELVVQEEYLAAMEEMHSWFEDSLSQEELFFLRKEYAKLLWANQQRSEAQAFFLKSLDSSFYKKNSARDEPSIRNALDALYRKSWQSQEATKRLITSARKLLEEFPTSSSLYYYLSVAYANQQDFISFFDAFYEGWIRDSNQFLAWKTRGVLHLRLFESTADPQEKSFHQNQAVRCLEEAFICQPDDLSLLMKMLFLLPFERRKEYLQKMYGHLLRLSNPPARYEFFYFIEQALELESLDVARALLQKAQEWYQYSRAVEKFSAQLLALENTSVSP